LILMRLCLNHQTNGESLEEKDNLKMVMWKRWDK
jgi:hypothetical protein